MNLFFHYLADRKKTWAGLLLIALISASVYYLYSYRLDAVLYAGLISGVLILLLLVLPDFLQYRKKHQVLTEMKTVLPAGISRPEYEKGGLIEHDLLDVCDALFAKIFEQEALARSRQDEMLEYYTLWVHQIKTPIAAMRLILQSEKTAAGEAIGQELFKIERYVEMVLGYLRLDTMSSDLQLASVGVHGIVRQAVKKFAPMFIYQKLSLTLCDFDNTVITDEKWLLFALEQILSNSLKYTQKGGVTIDMDGHDVLSIRDSGVGISPEDLPRIFERGFTGYNGRADKTSTGLGLYLTKRVLDKLQSPVEITSAPGRGTVVRIHLHRERFSAY